MNCVKLHGFFQRVWLFLKHCHFSSWMPVFGWQLNDFLLSISSLLPHCISVTLYMYLKIQIMPIKNEWPVPPCHAGIETAFQMNEGLCHRVCSGCPPVPSVPGRHFPGVSGQPGWCDAEAGLLHPKQYLSGRWVWVAGLIHFMLTACPLTESLATQAFQAAVGVCLPPLCYKMEIITVHILCSVFLCVTRSCVNGWLYSPTWSTAGPCPLLWGMLSWWMSLSASILLSVWVRKLSWMAVAFQLGQGSTYRACFTTVLEL